MLIYPQGLFDCQISDRYNVHVLFGAHPCEKCIMSMSPVTQVQEIDTSIQETSARAQQLPSNSSSSQVSTHAFEKMNEVRTEKTMMGRLVFGDWAEQPYMTATLCLANRPHNLA